MTHTISYITIHSLSKVQCFYINLLLPITTAPLQLFIPGVSNFRCSVSRGGYCVQALLRTGRERDSSLLCVLPEQDVSLQTEQMAGPSACFYFPWTFVNISRRHRQAQVCGCICYPRTLENGDLFGYSCLPNQASEVMG